jgi:hypothetical protein
MEQTCDAEAKAARRAALMEATVRTHARAGAPAATHGGEVSGDCTSRCG